MKNSILILIVIFIYLFFYSCGNDIDSAVDYQKKGAKYFVKKNYKKAIELYSKSIELNKNNLSAYRDRASAYFKNGSYSEAIKDFSIVLGDNPDDFKSWLGRAISYYSNNQVQKAISDFENGLKLKNKIPKHYNWAWAYLGDAYFDIDEYEKSVSSYTQHLRSNPDNIRIIENRGRANYNLGNYKSAKEDLLKVLKKKPDSPELWDLLAKINNGVTQSVESEAKMMRQAMLEEAEREAERSERYWQQVAIRKEKRRQEQSARELRQLKQQVYENKMRSEGWKKLRKNEWVKRNY